MTRTNIDINDELVAEIMATYRLRSKREAVDFALRRARRPRALSIEAALAMEGSVAWDGDLDALKATRSFESEPA